MGLPEDGHFRSPALMAISLLLGASNFAIAADAESDRDLLALARKHFASITSAQERQVFEEFFKNVQEGNRTKLGPDTSSMDAPQRYGLQWGPDRTIQAEWIVWLCKDPIASKKIPPSGIVIEGANVEGTLDLSWLKLPFPLELYGCAFLNYIDLRGASLRGLNLADSYIKGSLDSLIGDDLTVEGKVNLYFLTSESPVRLRNTTITGSLDSCLAQFKSLGEPALDLSSATIGSGVDLKSAVAFGEVRFDNAEIRGKLDCRGAELAASEGTDPAGFSGTSMRVTGDVLFSAYPDVVFSRPFIASGPIVISGAMIGGNLDCQLAKIQRRNVALDARAAKIDGDVFVDIDVHEDKIDSNEGSSLSFFAGIKRRASRSALQKIGTRKRLGMILA